MAYINQEMKKKIADRLKQEFPSWSFRLKILHHSSLVVTIVRADEDLLAIANQNVHKLPDSWLDADGKYVWKNGFEIHNRLENYFGDNEQVIAKIKKLLAHVNLEGDKDANFDESDSMTDYFHVGYYTRVRVGGDTEATAFQYVPAKAKKLRK